MYKQLLKDQAKQLIDQGNLIVADVRDNESFNTGHIESAVHLSMETLQEFCEQSDKTQPILVYCTHGINSQSVAQHLVEQGFTEVYSLSGGYEAWKKRRVSEEEE